nr:peptidase domain-containing ABC transporter [uncultured Rhodoferax sp.]
MTHPSPGKRRLPMYLQMEANECGLACLAMLAGYHGLGVTLAQLRQELAISRKGTSVLGLMQIAEVLKLDLLPVSLELEAVPELQLPCILHWDMEHFVVLSKVQRGVVEIYDPAVGIRRVSMAEFSQRFSGVAVMCTARPDFKPWAARPVPSVRDWLGTVPGLKRDLIAIFAATVLLEVLAIAMPLLLQWVVDTALPARSEELILGLAVGFALLVVMSASLALLRGWVIALFSSRLNLQWMQKVLAHLLHLPIDYFERRHIGDVSTSFASISIIQGTVTHTFVATVVDGLMAIGTLIMLAWISPAGAAFGLAVLVAYIVVRLLFQRHLREAKAEQIVHSARQQSHFLESLRGIQGIRLHGKAKQRQSDWTALVSREVDAERKLTALDVSHQAVRTALFGLQRVVVIWLAALALLNESLTLGVMFAFLAYLEQFSQRAAECVDRLLDLELLKLHLARVGDIVQTPVEPVDGAAQAASLSSPSHDASTPLSLSAKGLKYRYAFAEPLVVDSVHLSIAAGECVAITGPSGCGKTSLVKLLLGLHTPTEGEVLVNGEPLSAFGRDRLRSMVGTVMQDDILFTGSLADNISFFDREADMQWIEACARMASVHTDIMNMPMGYDSLVGEAGVGLSGGQKQRILLARALYRRPGMLVLDEATSQLDVASEIAVNEALKKLAITRIIVAHRPQTIAMADRIIRLRAGQIEETAQPSEHWHAQLD